MNRNNNYSQTNHNQGSSIQGLLLALPFFLLVGTIVVTTIKGR